MEEGKCSDEDGRQQEARKIENHPDHAEDYNEG
jgi:hypothetical protein